LCIQFCGTIVATPQVHGRELLLRWLRLSFCILLRSPRWIVDGPDLHLA
jgi:hypothetical protein